jgi:hypothetical protein
MLSKSELLEYSKEHLFYEIEMLYGTAQEIAFGQQSPLVVKNALVESFAFHLRNLIDFLYHPSPKPNDVVAKHFMDDPIQWEAILPQQSQNLRGRKTQADKQVAHLTEARKAGTHPDKNWLVGHLIQEMTPLFKLFVGNASPNRLHDNVKDFVSRLSLREDSPPVQGQRSSLTSIAANSLTGTTSSFGGYSFIKRTP